MSSHRIKEIGAGIDGVFPGYRRDLRHGDLGRSSETIKWKPNWIKDILLHTLIVQNYSESPDIAAGAKKFGFLAHMQNKLGVLSRSIPFSSEGDIDIFATLLRTLSRFTLDISYHDSDGNDLATEAIRSYQKIGLKSESLAAWFRLVSGLACTDQVLFEKALVPEKSYDSVMPLRGTRAMPSHEPRIFLDQWLDPTFAEADSHPLGAAALECFADFSKRCAKALEAEGPTFSEAVDAAREANTFIEILRWCQYRPAKINRPASYADVAPLLGAALADTIRKRPLLDSGGEQELAEDIVSAIRRRRLGLFRENLLSLLQGFSSPKTLESLPLSIEAIDKETIERGNLSILEAASIMLGDSNNRVKDLQHIRSLLPKVVREIRLQHLYSFDEWSVEDYEAIGLSGSLWRDHNREVEALDKKSLPGPEVVRSGDLVLEYTGQFGPWTYAHEAAAREAGRLTKTELKAAGLVPPDWEGKTWVGIAANSGDPNKPHEIDPIIRRVMISRSLGNAGNIFLFPHPDKYGPTAQRMNHHIEEFRKAGVTITLARLAGTDTLSTNETYTGGKDDAGADFLQPLPHILMLQAEDLEALPKLADRLRLLYQAFGDRAIFWLAPLLETHGSAFRDQVHLLHPEVLATLVNPRIIAPVIETWQKETGGKRHRQSVSN